MPISAKILADSINPQKDRITTFELVFPRIILAELSKHRVFSMSTSSSRAISFNKMVDSVMNDSFIPIAFQKKHTGMQGKDYIDNPEEIEFAKQAWLNGRDSAVQQAKAMYSLGITKQLCNRLLEPYMWVKAIVTATEFENFFNLRCPQYSLFEDGQELFKSKKECIKEWGSMLPGLKDDTNIGWLYSNIGQAEIHIMDLAEKMYDARNENTPKQLKAGEWHIPFEDKIVFGIMEQIENPNIIYLGTGKKEFSLEIKKVKISTALAARTSYTLPEEWKNISNEKNIELCDNLIRDKHMVPLEHCARAMSDEEYNLWTKGKLSEYEGLVGDKKLINDGNTEGWCDNFRGFISYRHIIENQ